MTAARVNVRGGSGAIVRGSFCTPQYVARALGPLDVDPFTNERSHVIASDMCIVARGDDGFGDRTPGSYRTLGAHKRATSSTRSWIQPDYTETLLALRHYLHTRFVALLRFDPRPEWNEIVGGASSWIGVLSNSPGHRSFEFEFPPGLKGAGNTFPHALYARSYEDVTPSMRALCSYPDGTARHFRKRSALDSPNAREWLASWGLAHEHFALPMIATTTTNAPTNGDTP